MANELFIPSMTSSGDVVLTTSLADYRKTLVDKMLVHIKSVVINGESLSHQIGNPQEE